MARWHLDNPYRLRDTRTTKGIQATLESENLQILIPIFANIWIQLQKWNTTNELPFEDCSIEISCINSFEKMKAKTKIGVVIRPAYSYHFSNYDVEKATAQLADRFFNWIQEYEKNGFINCNETQCEDSILAAYPYWDNNLPQKFVLHCFSKKSQIIQAEQRPLVWYPDLVAIEQIDFSQIVDQVVQTEGSGISLEWHAISDTLIETASRIKADGECANQLQRLISKSGVYVRLLLWGSHPFATRVSKVFVDSLHVDTKKFELDSKVFDYLIYDPWAFEELLNKDKTKLGQSRYVLTYDEISRILHNVSVPEPVADRSGVPMFGIQVLSGTNDHIVDTNTLETIIGSALKEHIPEIIEHIDKSHQDVVKHINHRFDTFEAGYREFVDQLLEENRKLVDKLKTENAELFQNAAPNGFVAEFSEEELRMLGVETEQSLIDQKGFDQKAVFFMRTALSLARIGMQAIENNVSLIGFYSGIGHLYEYLVRTYFQPALFDNTPKRIEIDTEAHIKNKRFVIIDLSLFDKIDEIQINAYTQHASLNGALRDNFYWYSWLNIFKPIRIARNKLHPERGILTKEQLACCYNLMLLPGVEPKLRALKYAYEEKKNKSEVEGLFLPGNMLFADFQNEIRRHPDWYEKSLIDFLLMCKDAKWV